MADAFCRDCLNRQSVPGRCTACGSPRLVVHDEINRLSIAHMDCDAFYAAVEKRDDPSLQDKPVIIGGGRRGVVSTCCYIARIHGVRSAMPMFKALELCPDAEVIRPRMDAYVEASRAIRAKMEELTPLIEPLSLDEAFLDLTGTERLHGAPPAILMARLQRDIEREVGVTTSVGLSHNKFLAKVASDLEKPRGFSVIGVADTDAFLESQPISIIWGVGKTTQKRLAADGLRRISDIRRHEEADLVARYGGMGSHLWRLAHGKDSRRVSRGGGAKSVSNETTFSDDISDPDLLQGHLWRMCEKVSDRLKAKEIAGRTVTLKLKTASFSLLTRQVQLTHPTQMADTIYKRTAELLAGELKRGPFRLIGVGLSQLKVADAMTDSPDLLDPTAPKRAAAERATDSIRAKFGNTAITKGRGLR